ncbi:MAG: hypothetical protein RIC15_01685 [Vicingaceae bacterium]
MSSNSVQSSDSISKFFDKRKDQVFYFSAGLFLVLALLSFDPKLSIGGDDASYIVRALRFIKQGLFPSFQGPLYPIFLSPFVALFGIKINLLKMLSVGLGMGFMFFLYYALKDRINSTLLSFTVLYAGVNSYLIYYSSQTYNEVFHLFIECLFIYFFFRFTDKLGDEDTLIKRDLKNWIIISFLALLVVLSKNIGLAIAISIPVYFIFRRQFLSSVVFLGIFSFMYLTFRFLRDLIWQVDSPFAKQGQVFLYKDPYNFSKGKEDIWGFLNRLYENTHIYFSKNLMKIVHLREPEVTSRLELISYIVVGLLLFAFVRSLMKNKEVFFISVFTLITLGVSFIILQSRWDSDRLIILVVPFLILLLLYAITELLGILKKRFISITAYGLLALLLMSNISFSFSKVDILTMKKNLRGERYHGYTSDWVNYLKMSEWASENLPKGSVVAVRKQTMSIIFTGSLDFHSIARVPSTDADILMDKLKKGNVTHVIIARLRRNPKQKSEYTINTVQRYLSVIERKYPGTFYPVHEIGVSEEAKLYEIRYPR